MTAGDYSIPALALVGVAILLKPQHLAGRVRMNLNSKQYRFRHASHLAPGTLGALLGYSITVLHPIIPRLLLGSTAGILVGVTVRNSNSRSTRQRRTKDLELALIGLLESLQIKIAGGSSLTAALGSMDTFGNKDLSLLQGLLKSGLDNESICRYWIEEFDTISKRRFADLLRTKMAISETISVIEGLIEELRLWRKVALVAELERRNQLVWIPVTIAVLLPGMIFLAIPLESTLHSVMI